MEDGTGPGFGGISGWRTAQFSEARLRRIWWLCTNRVYHTTDDDEDRELAGNSLKAAMSERVNDSAERKTVYTKRRKASRNNLCDPLQQSTSLP